MADRYEFLIANIARNIIDGLDQFAGTLFGISADVTISAYAYYKWPKVKMERLINWLLSDPQHCMKSFVSEYRDIVNDYGATNG